MVVQSLLCSGHLAYLISCNSQQFMPFISVFTSQMILTKQPANSLTTYPKTQNVVFRAVVCIFISTQIKKVNFLKYLFVYTRYNADI
jgi:hypothetical protein